MAATATPPSDSDTRRMSRDINVRHHRGDSDTHAYRVAVWGLLGCTGLVAAVTFALSFHGLDDYGVAVAGLGILSPLVPIGVDGLTLSAIAATFLLSQARLRVRVYAWGVFSIANLGSVAGNLSHAHARHLSWDGAAGAAFWPILLTLATHLGIVTRRHLIRHGKAPPGATGTATRVATPAEPPATGVATSPDLPNVPVAPRVAPPVSHRATGTATPAATGTPAPPERVAPVSHPKRQVATPRQGQRQVDNDIARQTARRRVANGDPCAAVARDIGVSKKTVERWTTDVRAPRTAATTEEVV